MYKLICLALVALIIPSFARAEVPSWKIIPEQSEITFTAIQNSGPVKGGFKGFTGDITFDPAQLDKSKVNIVISIDSLNSTDSDIIKTLQTPEWFDVKKFPKAVFTAEKFVKAEKNSKGEDTFKAEGQLTIRDKTIPVVLSFVLKEYTQSHAEVIGSTSLKRNAFGVGQGAWANPNVVKDDVQVDFKIAAEHAATEQKLP